MLTLTVTDTKTDTETDKMGTVFNENLSVQAIFIGISVGVEQCEHTIEVNIVPTHPFSAFALVLTLIQL